MKRVKKGRVESELKKDNAGSKIRKAASFGGSEDIFPTKQNKILGVAQISKNRKARMHAVTMISELQENEGKEGLLASIVTRGVFEDTRAMAAKILIGMGQAKSEEGMMVLGLRGSGEMAKKAVDGLADPNSQMYDYCEDLAWICSDDEDGDIGDLGAIRAAHSADNLITIATWALDREIADHAMSKLGEEQFSGEEEASYIMYRVENPPRPFINEEEDDALWEYCRENTTIPLKEDRLPEYEKMVLDDLKGRSNHS